MALTVTARHSGNGGETAAQTLTTDSATESADSLLLVGSAAQNDNDLGPTQDGQTLSGGSLTYTQVAQTDGVAWDGSDRFRMRGAVHSAPLGGSPSAHTITVDHYIVGGGADEGVYCVVALDVTGHDATTPIREVTGTPNVGVAGSSLGAGDSEQGTVELPNTPVADNKVVVWFFAGADGGGGFEAGGVPTIGGQPMTRVWNQNDNWTQAGCWERTIDGTESTNIVTCTDLGQSVGQYTAVAVEIAAESATATDVTANDAAHAHAADQPSLTQTHVLTSVDATHAHTTDQPSLTQAHAISVDSASHAHAADAAGLTQVHQLTADDAGHVHTADQPALTQTHNLTPASVTHAHSADEPTIGQVHALTPDDASHGHTADQATITSAGDLAVDSALHGHTAGEPALTGVHILTPADASHAHTAGQPVLTSGVVITPDDALHAHATEQPSLAQVHVLTPADAAHGHTAEQVALIQLHVLAVADALHAHAADAAAVTVGALPESTVTAQGVHSLVATAAGTHALTVVANGTHDLIVEAEGAL